FFAPVNVIEIVVAALYQYVWQQSCDQATWGDVVKDGHIVDVPQRREYLGSLRFVENRPIRSLQLAHRTVAINRDDQRVAECARLREIAHVSDVQKIENAVGKHEPSTRRTQTLALSKHLLGGQNLLDH